MSVDEIGDEEVCSMWSGRLSVPGDTRASPACADAGEVLLQQGTCVMAGHMLKQCGTVCLEERKYDAEDG